MESLRIVLRLNSASCLIFGAVFLVWSNGVSFFLGETPRWVILTMGALLLVNGLHLLLASLRVRLLHFEIIYFAIGDYIWFVSTLIILASGQLITESEGMSAALSVAIMVILLGCAQIWYFAEASNSGVASQDSQVCQDNFLPRAYSRSAAIGVSLMALKTWVKFWLFGLNGLFIAAIAFWPEPMTKYILVGYAASGPLLFAIMAMQRGLTRLLGVAHLIPWVPLSVYLAFIIWNNLGATTTNLQQLSFVVTILAVILVCLLLDIYDVMRWLQGDRFRFGSVAALRQSNTKTNT